jgi:hypothetical protein
MADAIVRRVNVSYQKFAPDLASATRPGRRAYVNELGFRLFPHFSHRGALGLHDPPDEIIEQLEQSTAFFISRLRSAEEIEVPHPAERNEALELGRRLNKCFELLEPARKLQLAPKFAGCGILDTCVGDVLAEPTLYEIKAGARDFRLIDVRQVITYCALNFASRRYKIERVVLVNPRRGIYAALDIHNDLERASGASASEVFGQILDFLSQDVSPAEPTRLR